MWEYYFQKTQNVYTEGPKKVWPDSPSDQLELRHQVWSLWSVNGWGSSGAPQSMLGLFNGLSF